MDKNYMAWKKEKKKKKNNAINKDNKWVFLSLLKLKKMINCFYRGFGTF